MNVDSKLNNIEIDFETADRIVVAVMVDQYNNLKQQIKEQKTIENPPDSQKDLFENPPDYQKEDLENNEKLLDAVITILKHYSVCSEWPEELKDE